MMPSEYRNRLLREIRERAEVIKHASTIKTMDYNKVQEALDYIQNAIKEMNKHELAYNGCTCLSDDDKHKAYCPRHIQR